MPNAAKTFKNRLGKALASSGIGVYALADQVGISHAMIYGYRDGKHSPSLEIAERIAFALGYTLSEFIGEQQPKPNPDHTLSECFRRVGNALKKSGDIK